jgi:hypothetical protein
LPQAHVMKITIEISHLDEVKDFIATLDRYPVGAFILLVAMGVLGMIALQVFAN